VTLAHYIILIISMSKLWYRYPNESEKFHVINRMVSNKIQLVYLNLESLYLNLCGWHQRHSYARHHLTRYGHYAIGQNILNYFFNEFSNSRKVWIYSSGWLFIL